MHTGQVIEQDAGGFLMHAASLDVGTQADYDFTQAEVEYGLKICQKRRAPGEFGISNEALKMLGREHVQSSLEGASTDYRDLALLQIPGSLQCSSLS